MHDIHLKTVNRICINDATTFNRAVRKWLENTNFPEENLNQTALIKVRF